MTCTNRVAALLLAACAQEVALTQAHSFASIDPPVVASDVVSAAPTFEKSMPVVNDDSWHRVEVDIPNSGVEPLEFDEHQVACKSCTRVLSMPRQIAAGATATVTLEVWLGARRGVHNFRAFLKHEGKLVAVVHVKAFRAGIASKPSDVYIGDVLAGSNVARSFEIRTFGLEGMDVTAKIPAQSAFTLTLTPEPLSDEEKSAGVTGLFKAVADFHPQIGTPPGPTAMEAVISGTYADARGVGDVIVVNVRGSCLPDLKVSPPSVLFGAVGPEDVLTQRVKLARQGVRSSNISCTLPAISASVVSGSGDSGGSVIEVTCKGALATERVVAGDVTVRDDAGVVIAKIPVHAVAIAGTNAQPAANDGPSLILESLLDGELDPQLLVGIEALPDEESRFKQALVRVSGAAGIIGRALKPRELRQCTDRLRELGALPQFEVSGEVKRQLRAAWDASRPASLLGVPELRAILAARRAATVSSRSVIHQTVWFDQTAVRPGSESGLRVMTGRSTKEFAHADAFWLVRSTFGRTETTESGSRMLATDGQVLLVHSEDSPEATLMPLQSRDVFGTTDLSLEALGGLAGDRVRGTAQAKDHDLAAMLEGEQSASAFVEEGGERIDGVWTIRVRIGLRPSLLVWLAPSLGFAPVRVEQIAAIGSHMVRGVREMSDFRRTESGLYLPWRWVYSQHLIGEDGKKGREFARREYRVETYVANCYDPTNIPELADILPAGTKVEVMKESPAAGAQSQSSVIDESMPELAVPPVKPPK